MNHTVEIKKIKEENNGWEGLLARETVTLSGVDEIYTVQHILGLDLKTYVYRTYRGAEAKFDKINNRMVKKA